MLWLAGKHQAGMADLVAAELAKLHEHLLAPLGAPARPATLGQAIGGYRAARRRCEQRLNCQVPGRRAGRHPGTAVDGGPPGSRQARRRTGVTGHAR
jgi:hypothetical protein